jgi:hypothetical protein
MMMMMCKRLAQVPMLCVPIYNMKLAMMQKTLIFTTFSAHTKMAADKRGQIEVFARNVSIWRSYWFHMSFFALPMNPLRSPASPRPLIWNLGSNGWLMGNFLNGLRKWCNSWGKSELYPMFIPCVPNNSPMSIPMFLHVLCFLHACKCI